MIVSLKEHRRRTHEKALDVAVESLCMARVTNRPISEIRQWAQTVITQCNELEGEHEQRTGDN